MVPLRIQRWTLKRVDDAHRRFFKSRKGYPRFRGKGRWRSFGFSEFKGISFDGRRLRFDALPGALRIHAHRPLPSGSSIRACSFTRDVKGWSVTLQFSMDAPEKRAIDASIGIDLGLKVFAYQSDGVVIPNPRIARRAEKKMRVRQRALARCRKGSRRREKARKRHERLHAKIANARATWLHQQSARITSSYDLIAIEDLRPDSMIKHPTMARSIGDASWGKFALMLAYKAERAGGHLVRVSARGTTQRCSGCGDPVPKSLAVRTHSCPSCGLVIDRDWNAAKNILQAVAGLGQPNVAQWGERAAGNIE